MAADTIAILQVVIETELAPLRKDLDQAEKEIERANKKIIRIIEKQKTKAKEAGKGFDGLAQKIKGALKGAAGFIGVGSVAALGAFATRLVNVADELGNVSTRLGIAAEDLQALSFVADQAGIAQAQFTTGLQRFIRRTGEARVGTGVLAKEFRKLGIDLKNADGTAKDSTVIFQEFLQKLRDTGASAEKLRLAVAAFDTEGAAFVQLAELGAEAQAKLNKRLKEAGGIIANETIKELQRLKAELAFFATVSTAQASNAFASFLQTLRLVPEVSGFADFGEDVQGVSDELFVANRELERLTRFLESAKEGLEEDPGTGITGAVNRAAAALRDDAGRIERLTPQVAAAQARVDELKASLAELMPQAATEEVDTQRRTDEQKKLDQKLLGLQAKQDDDLVALARLKTDAIISEIERLFTSDEDIKERTLLAERFFQGEVLAIVSASVREQADVKEKARLEEEKEEAAELKKKTDRRMKELASFRMEVGGVFKELARGGDDVFQRLAESFRTKFIDKAIDDLVNGGLFDFISGIKGGPTGQGGGGKTGFLGSIGGFIGGLFGGGPPAPGAASGAAVVRAGQVFTVGEQGPERFRARQPGSIIPNGGSMGGGAIVNIQVINTTGASVRTTQQRNGPDGKPLVRLLVGETARNVLRGGQVLQALESRTATQRVAREN